MANAILTVKGWDGQVFDQNSIESLQGRFLKTYCLLNIAAGSYATGGLTLDFTNGGVNSAVPPLGGTLVSVLPIANGPTASLSGAGGEYRILKGTTLANWLLKMFVDSAGSIAEYTAGALGTDVLTDVVLLECIWKR